MKPHAFFAALVTFVAAHAAHAADGTSAHASFKSTAGLSPIATETCALRPALTTTTTRPVAVSVGSRPCASNPASAEITLTVRVLRGDGNQVSLDATAPSDVAPRDLDALVQECAQSLKARLALDELRTPAPMLTKSEEPQPSPTSPLFVAGVATTAIGATMEIVGLGLELVSFFKGAQWSLMGSSSWCSSCEDHNGEMVATALLIGSLVAIITGTTMMKVGKERSKAARVGASFSPRGGALRLTF